MARSGTQLGLADRFGWDDEPRLECPDLPDGRVPRTEAHHNLNLEDESTDEERPKNRRRVEGILSRLDDSSDDESPPIAPDLRDKLRRRTEQPFFPAMNSEDLSTLLKQKAAIVPAARWISGQPSISPK